MALVVIVQRLRRGGKVAIGVFLLIVLVMAVAGWIGYDHWWVDRYY